MTRTQLIFVVAPPHSGSTWVGYVLGSASKSAFLGEYSRAWDDETRVPCTLCAIRGLNACTVLHGAEHVPAMEAFRFAARRTGASVLVDNSKSTSWVSMFMNAPDLDCRVIHLVRDPRGWAASMMRRNKITLDDTLRMWHDQNASIDNFLRQAGLRRITVCYDLIALRPQRSWKRLLRFCGLPFEAQSLRYWEKEHHGFAANGASDALVKQIGGPPPAHFQTGDDVFYARHSQQHFHDNRWRQSLTEQEQERIWKNPHVWTLLTRLGYRLTRSGIRSSGCAGFLGLTVT